MIDSMNQERILVSGDGTALPYIMLPLDQLEAVEAILRENQVSFWVDAIAVSLNGKPEVIVINLGRGTSAGYIQQLLDTAK